MAGIADRSAHALKSLKRAAGRIARKFGQKLADLAAALGGPVSVLEPIPVRVSPRHRRR